MPWTVHFQYSSATLPPSVLFQPRKEWFHFLNMAKWNISNVKIEAILVTSDADDWIFCCNGVKPWNSFGMKFRVEKFWLSLTILHQPVDQGIIHVISIANKLY